MGHCGFKPAASSGGVSRCCRNWGVSPATSPVSRNPFRLLQVGVSPAMQSVDQSVSVRNVKPFSFSQSVSLCMRWAPTLLTQPVGLCMNSLCTDLASSLASSHSFDPFMYESGDPFSVNQTSSVRGGGSLFSVSQSTSFCCTK